MLRQRNLNSIYFSIFSTINLLFFIDTKLNSQTPSYIHYDISDGLPSNLVYFGYQDSKGILWFGTDKGLVCFDNNKFRTYTTFDGLPDPEVLNIWQSLDNKLWVSCFRKKLCYFEKGKIITSNTDTILQKIDLKSGKCNFYEDRKKSIWYLSHTKKISVLKEKKVIESILPDAIFKMGYINNKLLGLATSCIIEFDEMNNYKIFQIFDRNWTDVNPLVSVDASEDNIIYSFDNITYLIKYDNENPYKLDSILGLSGKTSVDKKGQFWVSSLSSGALCFRNKRNFSAPSYFLPNKKVTHIFEDNQGTYWFSTMDDGIYCLPTNCPKSYNYLSSKNIIFITADNVGNILYGDDEGNVLILESNKINIKRFFSKDGYNRILQILPIKIENEKYLLIVTDEGVYLESTQSRKKIGSFAENPKVVLIKGDNIYCGTSAKLLHSNITLNVPWNTLLIQRITTLGSDSDQTIWAGGIEGLYASSDSFQTNWGDQFPLLRSRIVALQEGKANQLWVVTPESGLLDCSVSKGRITQVRAANTQMKKPINNIQSLFREDNGRLWLATNTGIYGVVPDTWTTIHYDHFDGLANDDVRSIVVYKDTLWAGTASGVTRILLNAPPPNGNFPTYVTSVHYQQEKNIYEFNTLDSIPNEQEILLPSEASQVEVEFTGLDYRSRGNLLYECIMTSSVLPFRWWTAGNLIDWVWNGFQPDFDTTLVNKASLNFGVTLPPGHYKIDVTALTANQARSIQPDSCLLIMRPKWYATFWFHIMMFGIFGSAAYLVYQTRAEFRQMLASVTKSRFLALQAQINPHFIGNAVNAIQRFFYPPNPYQASLYTATLARLLRKTLDYSEKTFLAFDEEIQYCRDYLELARQRLGSDKFHYEISGTESLPDNLPFPTLFLQPILENATIHGLSPTGFSVVKMAFRRQNGRVYCNVQDNGPGLFNDRSAVKKPDSGVRQSKGMRLLKNKADILNQLYNLDLQISLHDLSAEHPSLRGARVVVSFLLDKALEAHIREAQPDTPGT